MFKMSPECLDVPRSEKVPKTVYIEDDMSSVYNCQLKELQMPNPSHKIIIQCMK
jgi:hypothetical protein